MGEIIIEQNQIEVYGILDAILSITIPNAPSAEVLERDLPYQFNPDKIVFFPVNSDQPVQFEVIDEFEPQLLEVVRYFASSEFNIPIWNIVFKAHIPFLHKFQLPFDNVDRDAILQQFNNLLNLSRLTKIKLGEGYADVLRWEASFEEVYEEWE